MTSLALVESLSKHFDGVVALSDFSCEVSVREILGLFGPNGAGKTTFFNVLSGYVTPAAGSVVVDGTELLDMANFKPAFWMQRIVALMMAVKCEVCFAPNSISSLH